jgi:hypothetical protein
MKISNFKDSMAELGEYYIIDSRYNPIVNQRYEIEDLKFDKDIMILYATDTINIIMYDLRNNRDPFFIWDLRYKLDQSSSNTKITHLQID